MYIEAVALLEVCGATVAYRGKKATSVRIIERLRFPTGFGRFCGRISIIEEGSW